MAQYLIFFNQQWVGDHSEEWFRERGVLARAVVEDMKASGVYVYAGGLVEDTTQAFSVQPTDDGLEVTPGRFSPAAEYLGGLTIVDVPDEATAREWAGRVAQACGWPQEVRRFG